MEIVEASPENLKDWLKMGLLLWPNHTENDLKEEFERSLVNPNEKTFLSKDTHGNYVGFQTISLRNEHVPGAKTYPVGYLEGIYVDSNYRRQGIARKLVEAAEKWAKEKVCTQIASDSWEWNTDSAKFHEKLGFSKVETLIHFIKSLD